MEYNEILSELTSKGRFYIDLGLERIAKVLAHFSNPQDKLKCIHVAGTNGKGSVCAMLEAILREAGYKTGLYTSPHINEYTERIKLSGKDISKDDFAKYSEKVLAGMKSTETHLTEFEILTIMMFLYFFDNNVEIVILETGMGGRLDATNIIKENICSIITQIDLDHTDRLGDTKDKIAYEKAGIIKTNCPVITSMGFEAIKDKADECNSLFILTSPFVNPEYIEALTLKGQHQIENLSLVITAINYLFKDITNEQIINGLKTVKHPCRFEYIEGKNIIIDASHNLNGIKALKNNLDFYYPNQRRRFIFGALRTKDYPNMMKELFEKNDEIYLYGFDYKDACTFDELKSACPYDAKEYTKNLVLSSDKLNIICGSFYMISQINF